MELGATHAAAHAAAMALLARSHLPPEDRAFLAGLAPAATLLWSRAGVSAGGDEAPAVEAFLAGVDHLLPEASGVDADRLVPVLLLLKRQWRAVPALLLSMMASRLATTGDRELAALEIQHVAHWVAENHITQAQCDRDWAWLLQQAQDWRFHDEIAIRSAPSSWTCPIASPAVAGARLVAVTSTTQMVATPHHKGVLCLAVRRDACTAGNEAWFFVQPSSVAAPEGVCLAGLSRQNGGEWGTPLAYAPLHLQDIALRAVVSVAARENCRIRLDHVRMLSMRLSASGRQAAELTVALGNCISTHPSPLPW